MFLLLQDVFVFIYLFIYLFVYLFIYSFIYFRLYSVFKKNKLYKNNKTKIGKKSKNKLRRFWGWEVRKQKK